MKFLAKMKDAALAASLMAMSAVAAASPVNNDDAFASFAETVIDWTGGALGVGLATTMLLMGGAIGVAKNSPMPALTGIAGAAFLHWGPQIIQEILTGGLVI